MSQVGSETRSTIILFIAILIAVVVTVWIILSFDKPNVSESNLGQTGALFNGYTGYNMAFQLENNI
jgi:hypothetical protein